MLILSSSQEMTSHDRANMVGVSGTILYSFSKRAGLHSIRSVPIGASTYGICLSIGNSVMRVGGRCSMKLLMKPWRMAFMMDPRRPSCE